MNEGSLTREAILQEQTSDEFCQKQRPGTYSGKCEFFLDNDSFMYRRQTYDRHQLLVPRSLIPPSHKRKPQSDIHNSTRNKEDTPFIFLELLVA
jgi:hypothetical protein